MQVLCLCVLRKSNQDRIENYVNSNIQSHFLITIIGRSHKSLANAKNYVTVKFYFEFQGNFRVGFSSFIKKNLWLFTIYPQIPGNSGWDVNGKHFFGSSHWKIPGTNGNSEKVVPFSYCDIPNRNSFTIYKFLEFRISLML